MRAPALLVAVALCLPGAACVSRTQTTVREVAVPVDVVVDAGARPERPPQRRARHGRDRIVRMVGGAAAGALIGGWLGAATEASHPDATDDSTSVKTVEGALLGAGVGVVAGWLTRER